jgi:Na+-transporting methylmalonyl-CoA/oxaloacetate decarboxylase gamma subunit
MSAPASALLILAALHGEGFGIEDGHATMAADGAALVMLGVVFFVASLLAVFAWTMRRRARRPDPTLEFLASLKDESKPGPHEAGALEKWERPADWWKQE